MSRKEYRLGQKIRVRVEDADPMQKTVDFVLAEEPETWESIENE
jgi:exoribonuclease R